jgi:hypothetical protein
MKSEKALAVAANDRKRAALNCRASTTYWNSGCVRRSRVRVQFASPAASAAEIGRAVTAGSPITQTLISVFRRQKFTQAFQSGKIYRAVVYKNSFLADGMWTIQRWMYDSAASSSARASSRCRAEKRAYSVGSRRRTSMVLPISIHWFENLNLPRQRNRQAPAPAGGDEITVDQAARRTLWRPNQTTAPIIPISSNS